MNHIVSTTGLTGTPHPYATTSTPATRNLRKFLQRLYQELRLRRDPDLGANRLVSVLATDADGDVTIYYEKPAGGEMLRLVYNRESGVFFDA